MNTEKKWKWKTIVVDGRTVAQGWECPVCGVVLEQMRCCSCKRRMRAKQYEKERKQMSEAIETFKKEMRGVIVPVLDGCSQLCPTCGKFFSKCKKIKNWSKLKKEFRL